MTKAILSDRLEEARVNRVSPRTWLEAQAERLFPHLQPLELRMLNARRATKRNCNQPVEFMDVGTCILRRA